MGMIKNGDRTDSVLYAPIATVDVKSRSKQLGSKKNTMVEGQQEQPGRYCPICETWMDDEICPTDQVPTIRRETLEEHSDTLAEGTVLGGRYSVSKLTVWVAWVPSILRPRPI